VWNEVFPFLKVFANANPLYAIWLLQQSKLGYRPGLSRWRFANINSIFFSWLFNFDFVTRLNLNYSNFILQFHRKTLSNFYNYFTSSSEYQMTNVLITWTFTVAFSCDYYSLFWYAVYNVSTSRSQPVKRLSLSAAHSGCTASTSWCPSSDNIIALLLLRNAKAAEKLGALNPLLQCRLRRSRYVNEVDGLKLLVKSMLRRMSSCHVQ